MDSVACITKNKPSQENKNKNEYTEMKTSISEQNSQIKQLHKSDTKVNIKESERVNAPCNRKTTNLDNNEEKREETNIMRNKTKIFDDHSKGDLQITVSKEIKLNENQHINIIDMLTEKQFEDDPNVATSPKNFLVYRVRLAELTGSPLDYIPGDNGFFRVVLALALLIMYLQMDFVMIMALVAKCVRHVILSVKGFMLMLFCLTNLISINYIFCCSSQARIPPFSRTLLIIAASSQGYILAYIDLQQNGVGKGIAITSTIMAAVCFICAQTKYDFLSKNNLMKLVFLAFALALVSVCLIKFTSGFYDNEVLNFNTILILMSSFWFGMCIPFEIRLLIQKKVVDIGNRDYHQGAFMIFISYMDVFFKCLEAHD